MRHEQTLQETQQAGCQPQRTLHLRPRKYVYQVPGMVPVKAMTRRSPRKLKCGVFLVDCRRKKQQRGTSNRAEVEEIRQPRERWKRPSNRARGERIYKAYPPAALCVMTYSYSIFLTMKRRAWIVVASVEVAAAFGLLLSTLFFQTISWVKTDQISLGTYPHIIDIDDDLLVAGFPYASHEAGEVAIFRQVDGEWNQEVVLTSGSDAKSRFGYSVAVWKGTATVGAPNHQEEDGGPVNAGAVYTFSKDENGLWTEQAKLVSDEAQEHFGFNVDLDHDTLAVASMSNFTYIFRFQGGSWSKEATLPAGGILNDGQTSLAIHNRTLVLGKPKTDDWLGAIVIYTMESDGVWTEQATISGPILSQYENVLVAGYYGYSLDIQGERIVVGAPALPNSHGAVYVLERHNGVWIEQAKLVPSGRSFRFGGVSLGKDTLAVGCEDQNGNLSSGAVYMFALEAGGSWTQQAVLKTGQGESVTQDFTFNYGGANTVAVRDETVFFDVLYHKTWWKNISNATSESFISVYEHLTL